MEREKIYRAALCHIQDEWAECLLAPGGGDSPKSAPAPATLKYDVPLNLAYDKLPDPYPDNDKKRALRELSGECRKCRLCPLGGTATNPVFGEGNPDTDIVFVGEAPGESEDLLGRPFVGRAGKLLTATLHGLGIARPEIYICNILKHRPPDNRQPQPDETAACTPFLQRQLNILQPKLIIAMGNHSAQFLLDTKEGINRLRGDIRDTRFGFKVFPTFHPAYILRNMPALPDFTADLEKAIRFARGDVK
ncbi:MAG: uracil-DNA glycosylase [Brevinematales bacterium]|nr:uracil-DNA glycosylase [Brevinematales bacterium]